MREQASQRQNHGAMALACCVVGCVSYGDQGWDGPTVVHASAEVVGSNVLFAGSCSQRRQCSVRSASLPAGQLQWACDGNGTCTDDALWVAAPRSGALGLTSNKLCGRTVKMCKGTKCVNAVVRDDSLYADKWEASQGTLLAMGIASGVKDGTCGAYGGDNLPVTLAQ